MKRSASFSSRKRGGSNPHRSAGIALFVIVGAFIAIASACSNQGEGERCEFANFNDDCKTDEGLICWEARFLNDTESDRCCPADRSKATHPVCREAQDTIGDGSTPPDTGPVATPEASTPDADASDNDAGDASDDAGDADAGQ